MQGGQRFAATASHFCTHTAWRKGLQVCFRHLVVDDRIEAMCTLARSKHRIDAKNRVRASTHQPFACRTIRKVSRSASGSKVGVLATSQLESSLSNASQLLSSSGPKRKAYCYPPNLGIECAGGAWRTNHPHELAVTGPPINSRTYEHSLSRGRRGLRAYVSILYRDTHRFPRPRGSSTTARSSVLNGFMSSLRISICAGCGIIQLGRRHRYQLAANPHQDTRVSFQASSSCHKYVNIRKQQMKPR